MKGSRINFIFYVLAYLAAFAVLGYAFYFLYSVIQKESAGIFEAEAQIAALEKKEREFADAVMDLAEFKKELAALEGSFVSETTFVAYLESVEGLGRRTGVNFEALSANFEVAAGQPASFSFRASGDLGELVNFFTLLDNLPQAGILERVSLSPAGAGGEITASATYLIFNHLR